MLPNSPKLLWDILDSAPAILRITAEMTFDEFSSATDVRAADMRAAVERYFGVVREASRRLRDYDPGTANRLPGLHQAIGTRNAIAHEYDDINYALLWRAIQNIYLSCRMQLQISLRSLVPRAAEGEASLTLASRFIAQD